VTSKSATRRLAAEKAKAERDARVMTPQARTLRLGVPRSHPIALGKRRQRIAWWR